MRKFSNYVKSIPKGQAIATLDQAAPVQDTWYTILNTNTKRDCKIIRIATRVETANETLQIRVTIDGVAVSSASLNATFGTMYSWWKAIWTDAQTETWYYGNISAVTAPYIAEGRSVKVEMRKTTAAGAGNLRGAVLYSQW